MKNYNTYICRAVFAVLACFCFAVVFAAEEEAKTITLKAPQFNKGLPLMQALKERKSVREFSDKEIDLQILSNLLWAANGVNRPDGKRTAPSALDRRDIEIYVCQKDGAYHYQADKNILTQLSTEDCRLRNAPITLILVSDTTKEPHIPGVKDWGNIDGGIVSQNISLFASAMGLATVPQGTMPREKLTKILKLKKGFELVLNHPVGYPKEPQKTEKTK
jgi:nitroreductase